MLVWNYFIQLNNSRQSGMSINAISYQEIQAFNLLYKLDLADWEVEAIVALDRVALKQYQKEQEKEVQKNNKKK